MIDPIPSDPSSQDHPIIREAGTLVAHERINGQPRVGRQFRGAVHLYPQRGPDATQPATANRFIEAQRDLLRDTNAEQYVALLAAFVMFPQDISLWHQISKDIGNDGVDVVLKKIPCPNVHAIRQALDGFGLVDTTHEEYKTWFDALKEQAAQTREQALVPAQLKDQEKKSLFDQLSTIDQKTLFLAELATCPNKPAQTSFKNVKGWNDGAVSEFLAAHETANDLGCSVEELRQAVRAVSAVDTPSKPWGIIHMMTLVVLAALGLAVAGALYRNRDSIARARRSWLS